MSVMLKTKEEIFKCMLMTWDIGIISNKELKGQQKTYSAMRHKIINGNKAYSLLCALHQKPANTF